MKHSSSDPNSVMPIKCFKYQFVDCSHPLDDYTKILVSIDGSDNSL